MRNALVCRDTLKALTLSGDVCPKLISVNLILAVLERHAIAREYRLATARISWWEIHTRVAEVIIVSDSVKKKCQLEIF